MIKTLIEDTRARLQGKPLELAALTLFEKNEAGIVSKDVACARCNHATLGLTFQRAAEKSRWNFVVVSCGKMGSFKKWAEGDGDGLNVPRPFFCSGSFEKNEDK